MRAELGEGLGHLKAAAVHGAEGVGAAMGPRLREASAVALVPLAVAARAAAGSAAAEAARLGKKASAKAPKTKESKMSRKRTRILAGLLAAGAAAGITGALVARRRSRSKWDEYESQGRSTVSTGTGTASTVDRTRDWAGTGRQSEWTPSTPSTSDSAGSAPAAGTGTAAEKVADPLDLTAEHFADNASTASKNSRG
ncbi:MAG TPA: hypothetical protein VJT31_25550 [Rugosimonospora sp.]|nr:hypothetical protein [Rugosimonospora sp.]